MKIRVAALLLGAVLAAFGPTAPVRAGDEPAQNKPAGAMFPDLLAALKASPGCLGVEAAKTTSGKQVIFAWFENKRAVLKWYHSDAHQQLMKQFFPDWDYTKPLKDVADDGGPILAIASITRADKPGLKETKLPISQIAIELYQPLPGGVALGGRFAPEGVKVPKLREYSSEKPGKDKPEK